MRNQVGSWRRPGESNFIAGSWVGGGGAVVIDVNPADHRNPVGGFQDADVADLDRALDAATAAAAGWAQTSPIQRGRVLRAIARVIETNVEAFAADLTREEGKTYREAQAEIRRAVHVFDYYAAAGMRWGGSIHPSERPGFRVENRRGPLGVVAVITPWNFPFAIPAWKIAPALITGNVVVLKPAPLTPLSAVNLARACEAGGLPPGVLQLLHGGGASLGRAICTHPAIAAISFTGSTSVGRQIYRAAAEVFTPVQGELGGHNPLVVLDDADLDEAVSIATDGAFSSTGQKCTATRRILVQRGIADEFTERLVASAEALRVGDPMDAAIHLGPVISADQLELNEVAVQRAVAAGARIATGGRRSGSTRDDRGWFFPPTVLTEVDPSDEIAQREVFGPIVSVFPVDGLEEAIALANGTDYGLSAGICTRDLHAAETFVQRSQSGVVTVNAATAGIEVQAPLAGVKASGLGPAEQGQEVLEFFSRPKAVYLRTPELIR